MRYGRGQFWLHIEQSTLIRILALVTLLAGWASLSQALESADDLDAPLHYPTYPSVICTASAMYDNTLTGLQQLVGAQTGQRIYICGYDINVSAASTVQLSYGTGSACATGATALTPAWVFTANQSYVDTEYGGPLVVPPGNALCANITGTTPAVKVLVRYLRVPNT
jgi:hypothetical protein